MNYKTEAVHRVVSYSGSNFNSQNVETRLMNEFLSV